MVRSRNTQAKKLQSERYRFIHIFTFCCGRCEFEDKDYFDEIIHENDVYKPTVSKILGSAGKEQTGPNEVLPNTLDISPCTDDICDTPVFNTVADYPDYLNPFGGEDLDDIGVSEQECIQEMTPKRQSIDDYPEELNPFAADMDEAE